MFKPKRQIRCFTQDFPASTGVSGLLVELAPGGLRESHWVRTPAGCRSLAEGMLGKARVQSHLLGSTDMFSVACSQHDPDEWAYVIRGTCRWMLWDLWALQQLWLQFDRSHGRRRQRPAVRAQSCACRTVRVRLCRCRATLVDQGKQRPVETWDFTQGDIWCGRRMSDMQAAALDQANDHKGATWG